ncbi:glutamate ABC transporter substrate-binding protein [Angustibacter peucedani]
MSARLRPGIVASTVALAVAALAACTSSAYEATPLPTPATSAATATPSPTSSTSAPACSNPLRSYAPPSSVPTDLQNYATVRRIQARGRLVVGVSADTLLLAARNPVSGRIEGFDIDMARLVADAIFGDPDKIELRVITTAQRIPVLQDGSVDLVVRNMTINCVRWQSIAFSAEYYRSGQKVLVPLGSKARSLADLSGQRVCAPTGSTSLDKLKDFPAVVPVQAATHTGCLVKFQQGQADAITGDDTVLAGLAAQDPYARVVGDAFTSEPYGIGVNADNVDLVRYVNAVLARAKADGSWKAAYDRWLASALGSAPTPPTAVYGR